MPIYEYKCTDCNHIQEEFIDLCDLDDRDVVCENCSNSSERIISRSQGRPVIVDYYSENAEAHFTGPRQKERVLKEKGLTEAPDIFKQMNTHGARPTPYKRR